MRWSRQTEQVRSFRADSADYRCLAQRTVGVRAIPVAAIVGSVGRWRELRSDFMPVDRPRGDERYRRVLRAMKDNVHLPPITVYQLGDRYYVLDGHHRVAAAKARGQLDIDAIVTACLATRSPTIRMAA